MPAEAVTDTIVAILLDDVAHYIPVDNGTREILSEIIKQTSTSFTPTISASRVNGVWRN